MRPLILWRELSQQFDAIHGRGSSFRAAAAFYASTSAFGLLCLFAALTIGDHP